jgi:hypothetical protein
MRGAATARGEFAPGGGAGGGAGGRCAAQRAGAGAGAAQVADCQDGGLQEWVQLHITYVLAINFFLVPFLGEVLGVLRKKWFISFFFGKSSLEQFAAISLITVLDFLPQKMLPSSFTSTPSIEMSPSCVSCAPNQSIPDELFPIILNDDF